MNTGQATSTAIQYAHDNNGPTPQVSFSKTVQQDDTITVKVTRTEQGIFSNVFGAGSVQVGAHATARAAGVTAARWVAPIVVNQGNAMLNCNPPPCSGQTTVDLVNLHGSGSGNGAGSFALLDLQFGAGGNPSAGDLANWMENGYDQYMPIGKYFEAPSTNWNSTDFQQAMQDHIGDTVLLPVYKPPIIGGGSGAQFNIVGWVGFVIEAVDAQGSNGTLTGHFVSYLADALPADSGGNGQGVGQNFGVRTITLVD